MAILMNHVMLVCIVERSSEMRAEDRYLIDRCLNGESEAFGFLVDRYKESIYSFAYSRLGNFHDAEDVTQEVFLKAYQKYLAF